MADEDAPPPTVGPQKWEDLTHTSDWHGAPDAVLAMMADLADATSTGMSVTLMVNGGLLSGQIISAQDFFAALSQNLRVESAAGGDENKAKLGDQYARTFDRAAERVNDQVTSDNLSFERGEVPQPRWPMQRYVHLSDALFTLPDRPAFEVGFVRVLLSQVSGWTGGAKWIGHPTT